MYEGTLHRIIDTFSQAFEQLGVVVEVKTLEELAVLIHKAMTVQARNYHNLEHVLSLVNPDSPIQTLAALFHDIVYYQVDLGFLPEIMEVVAPFISKDEQAFSLARGLPAEDRLFSLARETFDIPLGAVITPSHGLNEFLSALVMNKKLGEIVPERELVKMDFCVEATIPFRGPDAQGRDYFERQAGRLRQINGGWGFEMSEAEIRQTICLAVRMANKDVASFAEANPGDFLSKTWRLLPETNVPLRAGFSVYSIREYREALQHMEGFFRILDPQTIFHQFNGEPTSERFSQLVALARRNIQVGRKYLQMKLLAQSILEALAEESGGDAPLSLFMGDLPIRSGVERLEQYLPFVDDPAWAEPASIEYTLLAQGRNEDPGFDLDISPLTLFIYRSLPPDMIEQAVGWAEEMFAGRLPPGDFLRRLPPAMVGPIARASAKMVITRSEALLRYA